MLLAQLIRRAGLEVPFIPIEEFFHPDRLVPSAERLTSDILDVGDLFEADIFTIEEFFREAFFSDEDVAIVDNLLLTGESSRRPLTSREVALIEKMLALTFTQLELMTRREKQLVFDFIKAVTPIRELFSFERADLIFALIKKFIEEKPFVKVEEEPLLRRLLPFPFEFIPLKFGEVPPGFEDIRRSLGKVVVDKPQISIPTMDDVIHIIPARFQDPAEVRARKRELAQRIARSPTPGWAQAVAGVLTTIDDTEDFLSTVVVIAALLVRIVPSLLRFLVPVISPLVFIVQLLTLGSIFGLAGTTVKGLKKKGIDMVKANPFAKGARRRAARVALLRRPGIGALVEGLQVSDSLFGVGISLGPIIGFGTDLIATGFRLAETLVGEAKDVLPIVRAEVIARRRVAVITLRSEKLLNRRIAMSLAAPIAATGSQELSLMEHIKILSGYRIMLDLAKRDMPNGIEPEFEEQLLELPIIPPSPRDPDTLAALAGVGVRPGAPSLWPLPGNPETITPAKMIEVVPSLATAALQRQVEENRDDPNVWVLMDLAEQIGRTAIDVLDGQDGQWQQTINPGVMNGLEALWREIVPTQGVPPAAIEAAVSDWVRAGEESGGVVAPYEAMKQIAVRHWGSIAG